MNRHHRNYELLGIRPGDSWQQLRTVYKSVVRKWHPDRFTESSSERGLAEEKTKEINRAFRELQEHYLQYGSLPLDEPHPTATRPATSDAPFFARDKNATGSSSAEPYIWKPIVDIESNKRSGRLLRLSLALIGLLLAGYFLFDPVTNDLAVKDPLADTSNALSDVPAVPTAPKAANFTIGSSLGEVHAIQGIPTRIDGEIWYYGNARVFFKNGKVSHWVDSLDRRLLAQSSDKIQEREMRYFDKGSTKAEVLTLQGIPLRETDEVWDYGLSRIYFYKGKVVGWYESPLELLHIKR